ncbi:MAG: ABC transporter ATP-binding protein [Candidatus Curtissbacteria bacterium]|nr:ABC transporter ATP-binding protein [Candidatus Curtissbacteria bacterium]
MKQIEFKNVTKTYNPAKGRYGLLTQALGGNLNRIIGRKLKEERIVALKNVSFSVERGETLGIIGKNGAGKSTILKLISKITYPDGGEIEARGRIGAFIELGAGLHPELSGRENIFLYGAILGMKKKEIEKKFDEIVDFAEIKRFLDIPIKKYSSGMYSRLGFSVCAFCDPDILLVDEVLAVGDINFQEKCLSKMLSFTKEKSIIFVSHNLEAIKSICSKVIYLEKGKIKKIGSPDVVIKDYLKEATEEQI